MLIRIGYDLTFEFPSPTAMTLLLYVHPERARDLVETEKLIIEPEIPVQDFCDVFGNRAAKIVAPAGQLRLRSDSFIRDDGLVDAQNPAAQQHPVANMFGLIAEAVGDGAISAADIEGLRQAHASAPARDDYAFALARALAAKGYYADAREVLGSLMAHPHWQDSHEEAMRMMRWVVEREPRVTAANSHPESPESKPADTATAGASEPATAAQVEEDPPDRAVQPVYRDVLKGEERAEGLLERVDCDPGKPATLTVRYGSRVQQYQAPRLTDIQFITYRSRKAGRFTCGPRVPPDRIYLTWKRGTDGVETPVAVEFLPVK